MTSTAVPAPAHVRSTVHVLRGLDGSNPLGFLAALGTLRLLAGYAEKPNEALRRASLGWTQADGGWRAVLGLPVEMSIEEVAGRLAEHLAVLAGEPPFAPHSTRRLGEKLRLGTDEYRGAASAAIADGPNDRASARWLEAIAAYVSDAVRGHDNECEKSTLDFTSAHQTLLGIAAAILGCVGAPELERALLDPWRYADRGKSLRWDPIDEGRQRALMSTKPSNTAANPIRAEFAGNALALAALPMLPMIQGRTLLCSASRRLFRWPVWRCCVQLDAVRSILAGGLWQGAAPVTSLRCAGIECVYECPIVGPADRYRSFAPARRLS